MALILDPIERAEVCRAAITRYAACEISELEFRVQLARCGLPATEIDEARE